MSEKRQHQTMFLSTIVAVSQIKFTLKCLLNSLLYCIGLLIIRNGRQYLAWFIILFIKLLLILAEYWLYSGKLIFLELTQ